jgi:hypothetical protein
MKMTIDELDDAANPNTRQVWIAALWAALVIASAGAVLLGGYDELDELDASLVTGTWAEPTALP